MDAPLQERGATLRRTAARWLPRRWVPPLRRLAGALRAPFHRGGRVECPCCGGRFRGFLPGGARGRPGARCPRCGSLERHRLLWLYLEQRTDLWTRPHRVLHFAPEPRLARRLTRAPNVEYLSADLHSPPAMRRIDVTDIPFPDGAFDVILCCHVLEHVRDDRRAMRELRRVLAPGGWAVLQTPVESRRETSLEDPGSSGPEERRRLFGQADHVRVYGRDFFERLAEAGFAVRRDPWVRELEPEQVQRWGLRAGEQVTVCTRPADQRLG